MMTFDDAARIAMGLPEVTEGERSGKRSWLVNQKAFAWERPFSKADLKRFGEQMPPAGPILAVSVADLADKEAVLAAGPKALFTIAHFDNYPAILIQLAKATRKVLTDTLVDGWLAVAPPALAEEYLNQSARRKP